MTYKIIFVVALALTFACADVTAECQVGKRSECNSQVCGRYRRTRPMPTVYNACMQGCQGAIRGKQNANCHGVCSNQPTPRPTTTNACQAGCFTMRDMFRTCPKKRKTPPPAPKPVQTESVQKRSKNRCR